MNGGGGDARVSIPHNARKLIQEIKKNLGSNHSEEFVYTTLKHCAMDPNEAGRRLKMIHDIREIAGKHSVEDVYTMLIDCNMDPNEAAQRLLYIDTFHEVKKKHDRRKSISNDLSEEYKRTRDNQWRGTKGGRGSFNSSKAFDGVGGGKILNSQKEYGATNRQERLSRLATPLHSAKENNVAHVANSAANVNGTPPISNGSYNHKRADVSSSTADPVVVPSQITKHTCAVGTINCEIVRRGESNGKLPTGMKVVADSDNIRELKVDVVEKLQKSESLSPNSVLTQNTSEKINPDQDKQTPPLLNEPLKETASTESITNTESVPEEESELKQSAPKLNVMIEKLTVSSHKPVIFPENLQVPENFKTQFTFGSLNAATDDTKASSVTESTKQNGDVVTQPTLSSQSDATEAMPPHVSDHVSPTQDNTSSDDAVKHEQTKVEMNPPVNIIGGFQHPIQDYSFGFMPHPHFVQVDVPEIQNGKTPATSGQNSVALSPPMFPYFRQPFPNYIPYNPYFPHMYLPPNIHLLNHGVYPQPPLPGNVPMQGVKSSIPSQGSNEDKDINDNPSAVQQGEDPQLWANMLPNYFYNLPQHMAFAPMTHPHSAIHPLMYQSHPPGGTVEPMVPPQHPPQIK